MTRPKHAPGYVPNDAYSQEDWDEVSDNSELTADEIAQLRPARELPPEVFALLPRHRGGRPKAGNRKVPVTIRLNPQTVDAFKATGPGWQTRMSALLDAGAEELK